MLAVCLLPLGLCAQNRQAADAAYENGRFAEALKYYEQELKTAQGETLYRVQLRTIACQYMLGKYQAAAESAFTFKLPQSPVWKARFLIYRAQTARRVSQIYGPALPQTSEENVSFAQLSKEQWNEKIDRCFAELWELRSALINAPIDKETLVLNIENSDQKAIPTLFDFVVMKWKERLLSEDSSAAPLRASVALANDFPLPSETQSNAQKVLSILAEAAKLGGKNRTDARVIWRAKQITLPFEYSHLFSFEDKETQRLQAAHKLEELAGYRTEEASFWSKIGRALVSSAAPYGKAYAALQAAELLNQAQQYQQAAAVCDYAAQNTQSGYYGQACADFAQGIREPVLRVESQNFAQDFSKAKISFTARNIERVYARVYHVSQSDLKNWYQAAHSGTINSWRYLNAVPSTQIPQILRQSPVSELNTAPLYEKPHAYADVSITLPSLEKRGFYAVVLCAEKDFDPQKAPLKALVLNNTDLALFASAAIEGNPADYATKQQTTFNPNVFRIYALNLKTGEPEPDVSLTFFTDWKGHFGVGKTNENGLLTLPRKITVGGTVSNNYSILPKAVKNDSTAFMSEALYFNYYPSAPFELFAETDRAVYRPGQKVQFGVYGFERTGRGLQTMPQNSKVKLTVRDANYQKAYENTLTLNAYGTAKDEFILPQTGLLGRYTLEVSYDYGKRKIRKNESFRVEEYKRPEYEIKLQDATPLQYGKEALLSGNAQYYFGAPLEKATVSYTVSRSYFRPPFWWWSDARFSTENEFITGGSVRTDKNGNFQIKFTPQTGRDADFPSVFTVHASVADSSGRIIETRHTYKAAAKPLFFQASFEKGFYDADTPSALALVKITDVNGQNAEGKFTAEIFELENVLPQKEKQSPSYHNDEKGLEKIYGRNKELRRVFKQSFSLKKGEEAKLSIDALPEGIYKLKLQAKNADTTELVFLVSAKKSSLNLPAVAIAQHSEYYPGTQAKVLIGAGALNGAKRVEVYQKGAFLVARELLGSGAGVYSLPIQNQWRGGVYLRWFGAGDYHFYTAQTFIGVPWDNKELSFNIQVPSAVKPGEKINWTVTAKNSSSAPAQGQASVRIYDKSLDYYVSSAQSALTLQRLYPQNAAAAGLAESEPQIYATTFEQKETPNTKVLSAPQMPQVNLQPRFMAYGMARNGLLMKSAAPMAVQTSAAADGAAMAETAVASEEYKENGAQETPTWQITPRTDFSETAYFNPMLPLNNGKGNISFVMPQNLTAWNITAFALTKNADIGSYTAQTVTRKDLMIRLSLPRFWREKDKSVIVAQVTSLSNKKQSAEVTLDMTMDGQDCAARFGIEKTVQNITVPAAGTAEVTWPVSVPKGTGVLTLSVSVRSGAQADAENRTLPLLPAVQRLAESTTVALESGRRTIKLDNLLTPDVTRQVSSVTLRVDPGLLLSALNAMPQLLTPRYENALSTADRYAPLAVINGFYKTYPMLQNAVKQLPERDTQTPVWDNQDPARLMLLEETPWLERARGGAQKEQFLTDLFNPSSVDKARARAEKDLEKYQTPSGGYSWLPGGEPSQYITLRLLSAYAEALRYGGQIPQKAAKKALAWAAQRIENDLKKSQASVYSVSHALYAAYVFTAFEQQWPEVQSAPVKKWLDYADKHARYMTPLGQTYASAAYYRLGENTKAQNYMDLVLSQMQTDPVTGSYFAPEAQSWLWYNDTLETQTAALRTLLEVRPESSKAQGLVKWLLFNRRAQAWDSSAATAQAVYSLLDYMKQNGLLDDPAEYTLQWGGEKKSLHFEPFDWSEQLAWTKTDHNVDKKYFEASVSKRGGLTGFVTLDAVYSTENAKASPKGILNVTRRYLLKYTENGREKVRTLKEDEILPAGSEVEVRLTINASSAFDFVALSDPKPAGFESTELLSGWSRDALSFYREERDAATNFFFDRLPAGSYTLSYTLRPTLGGVYHALPAQIQSVYAPQFSAHSDSVYLRVQPSEK